MNISFVGVFLIAGIAFVAVVAVVLLGMLIGLANKSFPKLIWIAVPLLLLMVMAPMLLWVMASQTRRSLDQKQAWADAVSKVSALPPFATTIDMNDESVAIEMPLAWDESVGGEANVYPGLDDCAKPLAKALARDLQVDTDSKYRFQLELTPDEELLAGFKNKLLAELEALLGETPLVEIESEDSSNGDKPESKEKVEAEVGKSREPVLVNLRFFHKVTRSDTWGAYNLKVVSGAMRCQWNVGNSQSRTKTVGYQTKPWLADSERFLAEHLDHKWLTGRSQRLARNPADAAADAFSNVNAQLLSSNRLSIKAAFKSQAMMERNVVDRFVQKISMPYGDVWREAVLICLDPPTGINGLEALPNEIATNALSSSTAKKSGYANPSNTIAVPPYRSPISPESALAILAGFVVLIGWVSNLLTQGYYRQQVNTTTVLAVGLIASVLAAIVLMFVVS